MRISLGLIWIAVVAAALTGCRDARPQRQPAMPTVQFPMGNTASQANSPDAAGEQVRTYRWDAYEDDQVQHGVPDTDDRDLWFACAQGRLHVGGPLGGDAFEGQKTSFTLSGGGWSDALDGIVHERGDGMNVDAEIPLDHLAVKQLMQGLAIRISRGDYGYEVPGEGAPAVLGPLIAACTPR